jgi:hypothetical protein
MAGIMHGAGRSNGSAQSGRFIYRGGAMNFSLAWRTTCAGFIVHMRDLMLLMYLSIWLVIAALRWSSDTNELNEGMLSIACFPTAFWWAFVSSRLLRILRDAERLLMPSPVKAIASAFLLQLVLTIIIPGGLCSLLGINFLYAVATLSAVAAGSMFFMLLPRYLGLLLGFMPMGLNTLGKQGLIPTADSASYASFMWLLAGLLTLLAALRFYKLRSFRGQINFWHTPMALLPDVRNGWGAPGLGEAGIDQPAGTNSYFNPAIQRANLSSPSLALRTYLGSPFMPLTTTGKLKLCLILALAYLGPFLLMWFPNAKASDTNIDFHLAFAVGWISFFGLAITFSTMIIRLQSLYARDNAELAELALLPGWKNSGNARRLLLQVMAQYAGRGLLIPVVLVLITLVALRGGSTSVYLILLAQFVIASFIAAAFCLNIISGKKTWAALAGLACVAFFIFALPQLLFSLGSASFRWNVFVVIGWIVFILSSFVYLSFSWRIFKALEHPFLRN